MKKEFFKFGYAGALMLAGAFAFVSCSSEDDGLSVDDLSSADKVKTQIAISLPSNYAKGTRMTADNVQADGTAAKFKGMQDIYLVPFSATPAGASNMSTPIMLTAIGSGGTAFGGTTSNAKVYNDVNIPVGTSNFVFYGKATGDAGFTHGSLTTPDFNAKGNAASSLTDMGQFALNPIHVALAENTVCTGLVAYLNTIANTAGWSTSADPALKALYTGFISNKVGSSAGVRDLVEDLVEALDGKTDGLSNAIRTSVETKATITGTDVELVAELTGYPANIYLPEGAAQVRWNASAFEAVQTTDAQNIGDWTNVTSLGKYVYPSALYYWASSTVKTNNAILLDEIETTHIGKNWAEILALYTSGSASVDATTQSVAIVDPIQYAVGRFDTKVKFANAVITDQKGDEVTIPGEGFDVTGVLVGGQKAVNWDFTTYTAGDEYTIYDKEVISGWKATKTGGTPSQVNHTLVLQTAGDKVNVALELVNNSGADFTGNGGNIIPAGAKFYVVGQLDKTALGVVANGASEIFEQDFNTIATFTISSLAKAYNVLPDLRSPKLELGLSVDLEWQDGYVFDVNI